LPIVQSRQAGVGTSAPRAISGTCLKKTFIASRLCSSAQSSFGSVVMMAKPPRRHSRADEHGEPRTRGNREFADSPLEQSGFEPLVPLPSRTCAEPVQAGINALGSQKTKPGSLESFVILRTELRIFQPLPGRLSAVIPVPFHLPCKPVRPRGAAKNRCTNHNWILLSSLLRFQSFRNAVRVAT
jgi:hypothetical protein